MIKSLIPAPISTNDISLKLLSRTYEKPLVEKATPNIIILDKGRLCLIMRLRKHTFRFFSHSDLLVFKLTP